MIKLYSMIYRIVKESEYALTTREICVKVNGVSKDYCLNTDGKGCRCFWWFRRPEHEPQRIRLCIPKCKVDPRRLYRILNKLVSHNLIKRYKVYLRDELSTWGYDKHVLYYVSEDQLRSRLKTKSLLTWEARVTK